MGGFSSLLSLNTIEDFERLTSSGDLPPGRPSQELLDSLPTPPPPKPLTWVDDGSGEPVPPSWMNNPGRDWYRVVFDDGTEMTAAEYRAWREKNGVHAPPSAVTTDGRLVSEAGAPSQGQGAQGQSPRPGPAPAAPSDSGGQPSPTPTPQSPAPDAGSGGGSGAAPPTPEEDRRRRLQSRAEAEAARRRTIATSWRGVLAPPPSAPTRRRKTLLGE